MKTRLSRSGVVMLGLVMTILGAWCPARAAEVAPRISDREIAEGRIRGEEGLNPLPKDMEARFAAIDKRFDDLNKRLDMLLWMQGVFMTVVIVTLGFVVRIQWQMSRRQDRMEEALETQKAEIAFLKGLIERFLPPRGAL